MVTDLAGALTGAERGDVLELTGVDEGPSRWVVVVNGGIGRTGGPQRRSVITQTEGAGERWFAVRLARNDGPWTADGAWLFEGTMPANLDDNAGTSIDPETVEVVRYE